MTNDGKSGILAKTGRLYTTATIVHNLCTNRAYNHLQQLLHKLALLITMTWCTIMTLSTGPAP
jgi:NADPH-dependent 7-cyano-7-deazaguanine reductase QueF